MQVGAILVIVLYFIIKEKLGRGCLKKRIQGKLCYFKKNNHFIVHDLTNSSCGHIMQQFSQLSIRNVHLL